MTEPNIRSFTYNHSRPIARASSFTTHGNMQADGIAPPYDCDLSPAEDGLILTVRGAAGGIRAVHLSLSLLSPIMEERSRLSRQAAADMAQGSRTYTRQADAHFAASTNQIMGLLSEHGIHVPHGPAESSNRDTAGWLTSSIYDAISAVRARTNQTTAPAHSPA